MSARYERAERLPDRAEEKLRQASSEMLEIWSERVLTASTLEEIFSESGGSSC